MGQEDKPWTGSHSGLVCHLVLPLTSCVALDQLCNFFTSQLLYLATAHLGGLLSGLDEWTHFKPLVDNGDREDARAQALGHLAEVRTPVWSH